MVELKRKFPVCKRCEEFEETFMASADGRNEIGYRCNLVESDCYYLYYCQLVGKDIPENCKMKSMQAYENMRDMEDENFKEQIKHSEKIGEYYQLMEDDK